MEKYCKLSTFTAAPYTQLEKTENLGNGESRWNDGWKENSSN